MPRFGSTQRPGFDRDALDRCNLFGMVSLEDIDRHYWRNTVQSEILDLLNHIGRA